MEKYIVFFRKFATLTGLLSVLLIILELLFKISFINTNGIYIAFTSLMAILFLISLYLFFILYDINKKIFICLKKLNFISILSSFLVFLLFGIRGVISSYYLGIYISFYLLLFSFVNLIIMSIIYLIKRTDAGYHIFKEWLYFFGLIAVFVLYMVIMTYFKS